MRVLAKAFSSYIDEECGRKSFEDCYLSKNGFQGERLQRFYRNVSLSGIPLIDKIESHSAREPPIIDANGDGIGRYDVFQLDRNGTYVKVYQEGRVKRKFNRSENGEQVRISSR